jgi:hypothetical protein
MIKGREGNGGRGRTGGKERRGRKEGEGAKGGMGWGEPPKTNPGYAALYETYNAVLVLHSRIFWFHQTDQKIGQEIVDRQTF